MTMNDFLAYVREVQEQCPNWRYGQTVFNLMWEPELTSQEVLDRGDTAKMSAFADRYRDTPLDPYYRNERVDAFLAKAVEEGVLT